MKNLRYTFVFSPALLSAFFSAYSYAFPTTPEQIVYEIKPTQNPDQLGVQVDLKEKNPAMTMILKGNSMGIKPQVENLRCDGVPLKGSTLGEWQVPSQCRELKWEIPFAKTPDVLASEQQSSRYNTFRVFSVISSLPRLQTTLPEFLKISLPEVKTTYPTQNNDQLIPLSPFSAAPDFILFNPIHLETLSTGPLHLTYYLDDPENRNRLPIMGEHLIGLQWLNRAVPAKTTIHFNIAWLGTHSPQPALSGAAGSRLLLVNYRIQGEYPYGKVMLLYVALHEAFHQLATNYKDQPHWISESLASYYGLLALQHALPQDPKVAQLQDRFQTSGEQFKKGLLEYNEEIQKGDRSGYGAFYTKGVSFWAAVDQLLQKNNPKKKLNYYLLDILESEHQGEPALSNLEKNLPLSPDQWDSLRRNYL
jgi:hypothetical protein